MDMKTLLALLVVGIIVVGIGWVLFFGQSNNVANPINTEENVGFRPDPANGTYLFNDGPITLSNGRAEMEIAPNSAFAEEILITEHIAYGDLNNDSKEDSVAILIQSGGGSGVFVYLASLVSGLVRYKGTNALFLGDRIAPSNIIVEHGVITVSYLDREPNEPFAAEPTVLTTKQFIYQGGELQAK